MIAAVTLAHAGALLVAMTVAVPAGLGAVLALAVTVSAGRTLQGAALRRRDSVVALRRTAQGDWELRERGAPDWQAVELADGLCHPRLVILGMRGPTGARRHVPILWDALAAEDFRRLRAALAGGRGGVQRA